VALPSLPSQTGIQLSSMSDDLYGDLDTSVSALGKKEALDQKARAEGENARLRAELALLQRENARLGEANRVLETNLSTLFVTAQTEIRRKDKEIQRLREELAGGGGGGGGERRPER
jgi:predicted RNase H-like nuclease (RuvC/YqgF family)